jgi:hypothetical protein
MRLGTPDSTFPQQASLVQLVRRLDPDQWTYALCHWRHSRSVEPSRNASPMQYPVLPDRHPGDAWLRFSQGQGAIPATPTTNGTAKQRFLYILRFSDP